MSAHYQAHQKDKSINSEGLPEASYDVTLAMAKIVDIAAHGKGANEQAREISKQRAKNAMDCIYGEFYRGGPLDLTDVSFDTAFNYISAYSDALPAFSISHIERIKKIYRVLLNKYPEGLQNEEALKEFLGRVHDDLKNRGYYGTYRQDKEEDKEKVTNEKKQILQDAFRFARFYEDFIRFVKNTPFAPDADLNNSLFQMSTINEVLKQVDPNAANRNAENIREFNNYLGTLSIDELNQFRDGSKIELSYPDYICVDKWRTTIPNGQLDIDSLLVGYRSMLRLKRIDTEFQEMLRDIEYFQNQVSDADQIEKMRHEAYKQCLEITEETKSEVRECFFELFSRSLAYGIDGALLTMKEREALRIILEIESRKHPLNGTIFAEESLEDLAKQSYDKTIAAIAPRPGMNLDVNSDLSSVSTDELQLFLERNAQDADRARVFLKNASNKLVPIQKFIASFPNIPEGIKNDTSLKLNNLMISADDSLLPNGDIYKTNARFWLNPGHEIGSILSNELGASSLDAENILKEYALKNSEHPESVKISAIVNSFRRRFSEVLE